MTTQNPNDVIVYSPTGEKFEVTRPNARDLTTHNGWTYDGVVAAATPAPAPAPAPAPKPAAAAPTAPVTPPAPEAPATPAAAPAADADGVFTTAEQFAGLDRDGVVAYLAKHFPDFKPHHKSSVEGLISKAIALATAEADESEEAE